MSTNDPTPMSQPRKLRARAADSEQHATNIMLAAQHLRSESDELPGMAVNEDILRKLHSAAASLLSCADRRRNDAECNERNQLAGRPAHATETAMANAGVVPPKVEMDEATQFAIAFSNARNNPSEEWRLVGGMWKVARYMNASSDDGSAWMHAKFHDGSYLRVTVDADGNLAMAGQQEDDEGDEDGASAVLRDGRPLVSELQEARDAVRAARERQRDNASLEQEESNDKPNRTTIAEDYAEMFANCISDQEYLAIKRKAHEECTMTSYHGHNDDSYTDMTFRDWSRIRFGPGPGTPATATAKPAHQPD